MPKIDPANGELVAKRGAAQGSNSCREEQARASVFLQNGLSSLTGVVLRLRGRASLQQPLNTLGTSRVACSQSVERITDRQS